MDQPITNQMNQNSSANYAYSQYPNQNNVPNQPQNLTSMQQNQQPPSDYSHYSNYNNYSNPSAPAEDTKILLAPAPEEDERRRFYTTKYIESLIPSKWKARFEIFMLVGGLFASEALDITKREKLTIKSCSLDPNGSYSLQNCVNYNVTDCLNGMLEVNYDRFNQNGGCFHCSSSHMQVSSRFLFF